MESRERMQLLLLAMIVCLALFLDDVDCACQAAHLACASFSSCCT